LLIFTSKARVFRQPVSRIPDAPVHSKGEAVFDRAPLDPDESVAAVLPERASGYVALLSAYGRVRSLRHHLFGEHMRPGASLYRSEEFGPLVAACWTSGDAELLIVSRNGQGIRFSEKLIGPQGDWGIRLSEGDQAVAITPVTPESMVMLVGANGKGTLRLVSGFAANKSAGGSGKIAMKTAQLVGATVVTPDDDLFLISRLGKIIRFPVNEVPSTEGVVQGVTCMSLRGDEVSTLLAGSLGQYAL
jgi:DNA gyrase subunit A